MWEQRKSLIIAVDEYDDAALRRLGSAAADARALEGVLGDPEIGNFNVRVALNKPHHEIARAIEEFFSSALRDDTLLMHFSGHGLKTDSGELFFAGRDTNPGLLRATAVSAEFVQDCMTSSRATRVVLLLDCCYGGAFPTGVRARSGGNINMRDTFPLERLEGGRGRAIITASTGTQYAFEGTDLTEPGSPQPSVFSAALVRGLSTGEADQDGDGLVSLDELYDYVYDRVREQNSNQTPSLETKMQGELYLARNPRTLPVIYLQMLEKRLTGEDLSEAERAHHALVELSASRNPVTAEAAERVLRRADVEPSVDRLDFGHVARGTRSEVRVVGLKGVPLARAASVTVSEPWIHAASEDGNLRVSVEPRALGSLTGEVKIAGLSGPRSVTIHAQSVPRHRVWPWLAAAGVLLAAIAGWQWNISASEGRFGNLLAYLAPEEGTTCRSADRPAQGAVASADCRLGSYDLYASPSASRAALLRGAKDGHCNSRPAALGQKFVHVWSEQGRSGLIACMARADPAGVTLEVWWIFDDNPLLGDFTTRESGPKSYERLLDSASEVRLHVR